MMSTDAIKTIFAVIIIKIAIGVINDWGSINVYILTYIHYRAPQLHVDHNSTSLLVIIILIPTILAITLTNKLNALLGHVLIIRISALSYFLSAAIGFLYFNAYTMLIFCMLIPVLAFVLSIVAIFYCLYSYFLEDKNKITSLAIITFGIGAILWNIFITYYANPNDLKQNIKDTYGVPIFFSEDVANRVPSTILIVIGTGGIMFIIGSILISVKDSSAQVRSQQIGMNQIVQDQQPINDTDMIAQQKKQHNQNLKSPTFILMILLALFGSVYHVFIQMNLKIVFGEVIQDDHYISNGMTVLIFTGLIGSMFWGYLGDRFGAFPILLVYCVVDIAVKIFSSMVSSKIQFMISMVLLGFTDKAILTLFGPGLIEVFGLYQGAKLLAYKFMTVIGSIMLASLLKLIFAGISTRTFLFILLIFSVANIGLGIKLFLLHKIKQ